MRKAPYGKLSFREGHCNPREYFSKGVVDTYDNAANACSAGTVPACDASLVALLNLGTHVPVEW